MLSRSSWQKVSRTSLITWCRQSTSTWAQVQNRIAFRSGYPSILKVMFTLGARVRVSLATNVNITEFGHSPRVRERCLDLVPKQLVTGYLGCVHTWYPSTSTRALAQNGAVFIHWEFWRGYLKMVCSHWCPSRIVLGHRARAPDLNAALKYPV